MEEKEKAEVIKTKLGKYFEDRFVNRASLSRTTGLSPARLSELSNNEETVLKASEAYLICKALKFDVDDLFNEIFDHLQLKDID